MSDDQLQYESPVTASYATTTDATLTLRDESSMHKIVVRADVDSATATDLAVGYGRSRNVGDAIVAGTRPDEWMVLGPPASVDELMGVLRMTDHVSRVDWTHGRGAFRLRGDDAARTLEKICNLDWSDHMTPNGAVVSASIAGATCDVVRTDSTDGTPGYLLLCDRSFGQYLFDAILDAGAEFGIAVS